MTGCASGGPSSGGSASGGRGSSGRMSGGGSSGSGMSGGGFGSWVSGDHSRGVISAGAGKAFGVSEAVRSAGAGPPGLSFLRLARPLIATLDR